MSRIINAAGTPATQRNRLRRTIAEALRRLLTKSSFDQESKDLSALIVYSLREIDAGIDSSAQAWEKRDYYVKADRFRRDWEWVASSERLLTYALVDHRWQEIPMILAQLVPHFQDIDVAKFTRSSALWDGAFQRLVSEYRNS